MSSDFDRYYRKFHERQMTLLDICQDGSIETPEKKLVWAVIERAARDAVRDPDPSRGVLCNKRTSITWLRLEEPIEREDLNAPHPWTFAWCADQVGWCPIRLRDKIKEAIPYLRSEFERKNKSAWGNKKQNN